MDDRLVTFLESLVWPNVNNRVLSYPADHKKLINNFRRLLQEGVNYSINDVREWLVFHQPENRLSDTVIDSIVRLSEYVKIDFHKEGPFYV